MREEDEGRGVDTDENPEGETSAVEARANFICRKGGEKRYNSPSQGEI